MEMSMRQARAEAYVRKTERRWRRKEIGRMEAANRLFQACIPFSLGCLAMAGFVAVIV